MIVVGLGKELEIDVSSFDDVVDEIVDRDLMDYVDDEYFRRVEQGAENEDLTLAGAFLALLYHTKANRYAEKYEDAKIDVDELLNDVGLEVDDEDYYNDLMLASGMGLNKPVIANILHMKAFEERNINAEVLEIEEVEGDTEL